MDAPLIWLVDLRQYPERPGIERLLRAEYSVHTIPWTQRLEARLTREPKPCAVFCDYDYQDIPRLGAIARIKAQLPSIPVVMFTEEHSEALAVWALRSRVWNYFVKPVDMACIRETIRHLQRVKLYRGNGEPRELVPPPAAIPAESRFTHSDGRAAVQPAFAYLERHLHREVSQREAAAVCGMTPSTFSRAFKRVMGTTFQEHVMERRLTLAARLLANRSASITDVSWTAGFRDISHFSRSFRRRFQCSPSDYRERLCRDVGATATDDNQNAITS